MDPKDQQQKGQTPGSDQPVDYAQYYRDQSSQAAEQNNPDAFSWKKLGLIIGALLLVVLVIPLVIALTLGGSDDAEIQEDISQQEIQENIQQDLSSDDLSAAVVDLSIGGVQNYIDGLGYIPTTAEFLQSFEDGLDLPIYSALPAECDNSPVNKCTSFKLCADLASDGIGSDDADGDICDYSQEGPI